VLKRKLTLEPGFKFGIFDMLAGVNGVQGIVDESITAILKGMASQFGNNGMKLKGFTVIGSVPTESHITVTAGIGVTKSGIIVDMPTQPEVALNGNNFAWIKVSYVNDTSLTVDAFRGTNKKEYIQKQSYAVVVGALVPANDEDIILVYDRAGGKTKNSISLISELEFTSEGIPVVNSNGSVARASTNSLGVLVKDAGGYRFVELGEGQVAVRRGNDIIAENLPESLDLIGVTEAVLDELPKAYERMFEKTFHDPAWDVGVSVGAFNTEEIEMEGARIGDSVLVTALSSVLGMSLNMTAYVSGSGIVTFGWRCVAGAAEHLVRDAQVRITVISAGV
jgi:hypothetical protein